MPVRDRLGESESSAHSPSLRIRGERAAVTRADRSLDEIGQAATL